ncbi:hypothetical protein VNO80_25828 [Phaseolus coccineus]|uniref:Bulb-type lectin domain-containing protein n=1 Tax=Phaseolus coccineus TaxID=3886 RepID=A0AAN9LVI6_PHACN
MRLILHKLVLAFMLLWLWFSSFIHVDAADDSLKPGDTLNSSSQLYSKSRTYYLQLFNYLEISSVYDDTVVWVGNREQSVNQSTADLSLNFSGVLKIESESLKKPIILYSPPQPINNTVATLLDTGNFVLQHLHSNGTNTLLWQSFDYPFATLIPTMKLGVNHKTGHRWLLYTQLTYGSAAPGAFSLEWEPRGQELMIRRRGKVCWKSGKLRNNRFEHIPEEAQGVLKYSIVSNGDEDTFSFTSTNENITHFWSLSGTGRLSYNYEEGYVARADLCYGYNNTEGGCQRWQDIPKCRIPGDVFTKKSLRSNYQNVTFDNDKNISYSDCEAACWSDCNCNGFTEIYDDGSGCIFYQWNSSKDYIVDATVSGEDIYLLENKGNIIAHRHGTKRWIWISPVIATSLLILCASILCLAIKKRKHVLQEKKRKEMSLIEDFGNDLNKKHGLKVLDYTLVVAATNEFSSDNKLGQGGFGPVYKVWELWKDDKYFELVDPSLNEVFDHEEVQRCIHIGLLCVEHYANDRPTMSDIISILTSKSPIVSLPLKPAFYIQRYMYNENLSSLELCTGSTVEITSSTIEMTTST